MLDIFQHIKMRFNDENKPLRFYYYQVKLI